MDDGTTNGKRVDELIRRRLLALEAERSIRIVYACESGSRAWGFASADSDYDVRFIYVQRLEDYLVIGDRRDTIDPVVDGVWDYAGWDIRKALTLYAKSNGPLLEWLQSPIVYADTCGLAAHLREWMPDYVSPKACFFHYLSMARGKFKDWQAGGTPSAKGVLYVLRPLLACLWLEAGLGAAPAVCRVMAARLWVGSPLLPAFDGLVAKKAQGNEKDLAVDAAARFHDYADRELERLAGCGASIPVASGSDRHRLDDVFRRTLRAAWPGEVAS